MVFYDAVTFVDLGSSSTSMPRSVNNPRDFSSIIPHVVKSVPQPSRVASHERTVYENGTYMIPCPFR